MVTGGATAPVAPPATSMRRWPGMRSEYSWIPPHDGPTVTKPHQIGVSFTAHRGLEYLRGGRAHRLDIASGTVFVTGAEPITWTGVREPTEALEIYPDPSLLAAHSASPRFGIVEPRGSDDGRDAVVFAIATILKRVHVGTAELTDVEASTLAHRLALRLLTRYHGVPSSTVAPPRGGLDHRTVERVSGYVEANLDTTLSLDRLAEVAMLSPFHFARAFKATTGLAPHQFVTACRVERAKALLLTTPASVPNVAYRVGFTNLSHFRRVFRRSTGGTPAELRAR